MYCLVLEVVRLLLNLFNTMYDKLAREDGCPAPYGVEIRAASRRVVSREQMVDTALRANITRYDHVCYTEAASSLVIVCLVAFHGGRFHEQVAEFS